MIPLILFDLLLFESYLLTHINSFVYLITFFFSGARRNIHVNALAPQAGTAMTKTVAPDSWTSAMKAEYVFLKIFVLSLHYHEIYIYRQSYIYHHFVHGYSLYSTFLITQNTGMYHQL